MMEETWPFETWGLGPDRPGSHALIPTPPRSRARPRRKCLRVSSATARLRHSAPGLGPEGEEPNCDFARTIVRHFFTPHFIGPYWLALARASDATLAPSPQSEPESAYHLRHTAACLLRLGRRNGGSHVPSNGVEHWAVFTGEMFDVVSARIADRRRRGRRFPESAWALSGDDLLACSPSNSHRAIPPSRGGCRSGRNGSQRHLGTFERAAILSARLPRSNL